MEKASCARCKMIYSEKCKCNQQPRAYSAMLLMLKCVLDNSTTEQQELHSYSRDIAPAQFQYTALENRYQLVDLRVSLLFYPFQMVAINHQQELNMVEHVQHIL